MGLTWPEASSIRLSKYFASLYDAMFIFSTSVCTTAPDRRIYPLPVFVFSSFHSSFLPVGKASIQAVWYVWPFTELKQQSLFPSILSFDGPHLKIWSAISPAWFQHFWCSGSFMQSMHVLSNNIKSTCRLTNLNNGNHFIGYEVIHTEGYSMNIITKVWYGHKAVSYIENMQDAVSVNCSIPTS